MKNSRGISVRHLFFCLFHFMVLSFLLLFSYLNWTNETIISNWSLVISRLAILLMCIQLISFAYKKIGPTDFRLWFIFLSYLFMFGRVFLNAFNLDSEIFWNLMIRHPQDLLYHSSLFIICCIQSIFLGFVFFDNRKEIRKNLGGFWKESKDYSIYITGLILLLFSLPFRLFIDIRWVIQAQMNSSYSNITSSIGLVEHFALLLIPGVIFIIASGKFNRKVAITILLVTVSYFLVLMILTGDRRYPVTAILSLILFYIKFYDIRPKLIRLFFWGLASMILLNTLTVIREIRAEKLTNLSDFISTYFVDIIFDMSTMYETLAEFGITFFSVVLIFKYVPSDIPFQDGFSFIASVPSILPIGWLFRDFFQKASMSNVINVIEGTGVGASLIGDLYINFGWLAILFGTLVGILVAKIFRFNNNINKRLWIAKYYSLFFILINLVRAAFFEIFRPAMIVYLLPLLIIWLVKSRSQGVQK
ncbi:O-antigen polysaccharide polymerase Wzy [Chengkuizengella sediminis]|uniref:O-antigen polysaccharide polymerase Wzy n=1 Tax=Chengkuizengella sediminis TaxID=1885917 RepID=UPI00138964DB|nr:O-antigen polysaccharide polymerase Wzy [Chengkuizengella sediminis]NDI34878.1 O-antigen polysaccharide polymerase Wzy [Chengkuizengella sediminis]